MQTGLCVAAPVPEEGPAEEGHGFHKALSSLGFSRFQVQHLAKYYLRNALVTSSENTSEPPDDKFSVVIDDVLAGLLHTAHLLFTLMTVTDLILEILPAFTTIDSWFHI